MSSPADYLFVYGTLRPGFKNPAAQQLHQSADHIGPARAHGHLYLIAHYPGFVPSDNESDWVHGDLYQLRSPELTLRKLDQYEGCTPQHPTPHEYRRTTVPVLLSSGAWIEAWVYIYNWDTTAKMLIPSGDFRSPSSA